MKAKGLLSEMVNVWLKYYGKKLQMMAFGKRSNLSALLLGSQNAGVASGVSSSSCWTSISGLI